MKSLKRNFLKIKEKNPYWSSIICFNVTTLKQVYSRKIIVKWFSVLVEKDDYDIKDKKSLIKFSCELSNELNRVNFGGKF